MSAILTTLRSQIRFLLDQSDLSGSRLAAVTGTTCSGKSSVIKRADAEMWYETRSEIYSALVAQGMHHADCESVDDIRRVQYTVLATQIAMENALVMTAKQLSRNYGDRVLPVIERSALDCAAYLPGGLDELVEVTGQSHNQLLSRYGIILQMGAPSEDVYEANFESNPHRRSKNYPAVFRRSHAFAELVRKHPRYGYVPSDRDFDLKSRHAMGALETFRRSL